MKRRSRRRQRRQRLFAWLYIGHREKEKERGAQLSVAFEKLFANSFFSARNGTMRQVVNVNANLGDGVARHTYNNVNIAPILIHF